MIATFTHLLVGGLVGVLLFAGVMKVRDPSLTARFMERTFRTGWGASASSGGATLWRVAARLVGLIEISTALGLLLATSRVFLAFCVASTLLSTAFIVLGRVERDLEENCGCLGVTGPSRRMPSLRIAMLLASIAVLASAQARPSGTSSLASVAVVASMGVVVCVLALLRRSPALVHADGLSDREIDALAPASHVSRRRVLIGAATAVMASPLVGAGDALARQLGVAAATGTTAEPFAQRLSPAVTSALLDAARQSAGFRDLRNELTLMRSEVGALGAPVGWRVRYEVEGGGFITHDAIRLPLLGDPIPTSGLWWSAIDGGDAACALAPSVRHAVLAINGQREPDRLASMFAATPELENALMSGPALFEIELANPSQCVPCATCKEGAIAGCAAGGVVALFCCAGSLGIACVACLGGATAGCGTYIAIQCNDVCFDCGGVPHK